VDSVEGYELMTDDELISTQHQFNSVFLCKVWTFVSAVSLRPLHFQAAVGIVCGAASVQQYSNICTADAQKRSFMNFPCKVRHRRSIRRPRFPIRVQNFSDLATFSVDIALRMLIFHHISTSGLSM